MNRDKWVPMAGPRVVPSPWRVALEGVVIVVLFVAVLIAASVRG